MAKVKYKKIRSQLNTGDIVLFSGTGLISNIIKIATGSKWSHVGVIQVVSNDILLLESTTLAPPGDDRGEESFKGVQINYLSRRIETYDGEIGIRRLLDGNGDIDLAVSETRKKLLHVPYEEDLLELAASTSPLDESSPFHGEDLSTVFCSELAAECYQEKNVRYLPPRVASNRYTPDDFSMEGKVDSNLQNGAILDSQILQVK